MAVILLFILSSHPARGEEPTPNESPAAEATATPTENNNIPNVPLHVVQKSTNGDTYQIGDRITLYVEIEKEQQNRNINFEIKSSENEKPLGEQGWYLDPQTNFITGNLRFIVSPIQTGELTLPSLLILNQDKIPILKTLPWKIKVLGQNVSSPQPNQKPEYLPVSDVSLSGKIILLLIFFGIVLSLIIFFLIKRWRESRAALPPPTPPPAVVEPDHVLALRALNDLYQKNPYSPDKLKPIAFGISEILKNYLSNEFKVDAREATTQEMLGLLRSIGLSTADLREIDDLFRDLDLIKFTKKEHHPTHFGEAHYRDFKIKTEDLINKWSTKIPGGVK